MLEKIIINTDNLNDSEIDKYNNKVRAILIKDNKLLISRYAGITLLPGGKVDKDESLDEAITRELKEETGIIYNENELEKYLEVKYYQKEYPTRTNGTINRLLTTTYYIGKYKGTNLDNANRTLSELLNGFSLELVDIDKLPELMDEKSDNPRKTFFDTELNAVVKTLK